MRATMSESKTLIGFDLDKTLIRSASWYRLNLAMGMTAYEDEALYRRGPEKEGELTYAQWMQELETIYKTRGKANRDAIRKVLLDYTLLDGAEETIASLQKSGHTLAIVTGGFEIVARDVANRLGITIVYANVQLDFADSGEFRALNLSSPDDRRYKADSMSDLAAQYNISRTHTFYVADGDNDEEVFGSARGVQITPESSSHEPWKTLALQQGEQFALHAAVSAAESQLRSISELPALIETLLA